MPATISPIGLRYMLKIGTFFLAPRPSIRVEESSDFEQLVEADSGAVACGCGSMLTNITRTYTFKLHINGGGSLATAWSIHARIVAALASEDCDSLLLRRRVYDEPELVYRITKASIRQVDVETQYGLMDCERWLTLLMVLTLSSTIRTEILTIYEYAQFPPPTDRNIIDFLPTIDVAVIEEAEFPEPENIFV